jgi:hypothetical protein
MTQVPRLRTERVNPTFLETNTGFSTFRTEDIHSFSEPNIGFSSHRKARGFSAKLRSIILLRAPYPLRKSGGMGKEPLSRLILAILFACTRVDTCHPWNCMRSIQHAFLPIWQSLILPQELRIKCHIHIIHVAFWNNNKILFPRLKPLGLALRLNTYPFFPPSSP